MKSLIIIPCSLFYTRISNLSFNCSMKLNIHLDFDDTYERRNVSGDLSEFQFTSFDIHGSPVEMYVRIVDNWNPLLPEVFNLGFGPLNSLGEIDDMAVISHRDNSKVYSTILLGAITFLEANPDRYVGIDGANFTRACLYYRLFRLNHDYLSTHVNSYGIKYYIRLLRGKEKADPLVPDEDDIIMNPFKMSKHLTIRWEKMFNYFVFSLC